MPYVDVLIRNTLGQVFTYSLPNTGAVGRYVSVSLRNKKTVGVVFREHGSEFEPKFQVKEAELLDDHRILDRISFALSEEISFHSFCSVPEALELFMYNLPKTDRKLRETKPPAPDKKELSPEQMGAADSIWEMPERECLLYGVTGSGKTEVYFELIRRTLESGKKALFLLPEISLTPQMTKRIRRAFSGRNVAVIHSKITEARKARYMTEIAEGTVDIVLGARSAVLSPLRNIGLILVDECHEHSYLQENRPRYDAIKVARKLAELEGAKLVLGSATPNVSTYYEHERRGSLVKLLNRYSNYELPSGIIVDMRYESDKIISSQLDRAIRDRLSKREQIILLINRKGFSSTVQCPVCGSVFRCPNCEISMTYYRSLRRLCCNYCAHTVPEPRICPDCGHKDLDFSGVGTEKIEAEIRSRYTEARVARIDRSVMTSNTRLSEVTGAFEEGKIDILIGTQMIAKGLDFPKVTLVGILAADLQLYVPHYQSSERAFQLFTQVSGRAGRSGLRSEVILQTYSPAHMAISNEGYFDYYRRELHFRKKLGYPPYQSIALLTFSDVDELRARESAYRSKNYLRKKIELAMLGKSVRIFDETPASLRKLENHYRYQILILSDNACFRSVMELIGLIEGKLKSTTKSQLVVEID